MTWKLAPSLTAFQQWVYAKWPHHTHGQDGTIGDAAHQARHSDHNPSARGVVDAIDFNENGIHMPTLIVAAMMHPSTHYIIYEGVEYSAHDLFGSSVYTGTGNPHAEHCHVSVWQTVKAENSKTAWGVTAWPTLLNGSVGRAVSELQGYLNVYGSAPTLAVDGHYGDRTEEAVRSYQSRFAVPGGVDGVVGTHTEYHLKTNQIHRM